MRGILVTEGVRGEGGVLRNKDGKRFMFDDIPDNYKNQTADNEEEGWRYTQGDKNARRPPELLTRDHVARCIIREVRDGRGSPHGGVFLDIAWIKETRARTRAEHIKKKLPSMYHQFKQLAGHRHHQGADGGRPDDALHHGRRPRRRRHADVDACPACSPPAKCAAGLHGANRLGGNSLSDLLVFGKRAGEYAAKFAKENGARRASTTAQVDARRDAALAPFDRGAARREPVPDPARPAGHDAGRWSASCAARPRCSKALEAIAELQAARREGRRRRQPRVQPRLAHRARPATTC